MPRPANALIIDDEAHVRVFLTAILRQLGIKTIWEAADGPSGLEQASLHEPDFVLLDLNLPEVSGIDVLEKLKAKYPKLPVIVVSAQSTVRTIDRVKELGADGYVVKYAQKSEVIQMLSDALERIAGDDGGKAADGAGKPEFPG
jgi:two-component system KDP operon response regulator KdpE